MHLAYVISFNLHNWVTKIISGLLLQNGNLRLWTVKLLALNHTVISGAIRIPSQRCLTPKLALLNMGLHSRHCIPNSPHFLPSGLFFIENRN